MPRPVSGNPALWRLSNARSVLLLQGPVGPFFDRLAHWLQARATTVRRVVLHAGDRLDCQAVKPIAYRGSLHEWPEFLAGLITRHGIDCVVLFGHPDMLQTYVEAWQRVPELDVISCFAACFEHERLAAGDRETPEYLSLEDEAARLIDHSIARYETHYGREAPAYLLKKRDHIRKAVA